jgi:membrane protein
MEVDCLQLEPVLQTLVQLDWIGRLNEVDDQERHALRAARGRAVHRAGAADAAPAAAASEATAKLWHTGRLSAIYLKDVL